MILRIVAAFTIGIGLFSLCCRAQSVDRPRVGEADEASDEGAPLPSPFERFQILPGSLSPDSKLALIYPKRDFLIEMEDQETARLVLVFVSPFRVLCDVPRGSSALILGRGSYAVAWLPDSSAFLMTQNARWGPDRVYLGEIGSLDKPRLTDLTALVAEMVRPSFEASKMPRYNDHFDFIFEEEVDLSESATGGWTFTPSGDVAIQCTCTNQPKPGLPNVWKVQWQGIWSRAEQRLIKQ